MSLVWPAELPQHMLLSSVRVTEPENVIRQQMDVGPAKVRKRGTAGVTKYGGEYSMTTAQLAAFRTFFRTTTAYGALSFEWPGPDGTESLSPTRFSGQPTAKPLNGPGRWIVSVELEVLP